MPAIPTLTDATLTFDHRVAQVTFDRDDVLNALTGTTLIDDMVAILAWADQCLDVSVIIVTGGGRAFSAGGNIKTMGEHSASPAFQLQRDHQHGLQRLTRALHETEVPVIAAVNGAAMGGGCDLAALCDIRVASTKARFAESFVNLGFCPVDGGAWILQRLVGYQRAAELTLSGRTFDAEEALRIGFVLEVTEPDDLLPRVNELAAGIAAKPPLAVRYAKRLMRLAQSQPLRDHLEVCSGWQALCHKTEDHAEALDAFFEKRPGSFAGR